MDIIPGRHQITVKRGSRGFGLSLTYRGLDKYEENETGIFVAKIIPEGQAGKSGLQENDKILGIDDKTPTNIDEAIAFIKQARYQVRLHVLREKKVNGNTTTDGDDDKTSTSSKKITSSWMRKTENQQTPRLPQRFQRVKVHQPPKLSQDIHDRPPSIDIDKTCSCPSSPRMRKLGKKDDSYPPTQQNTEPRDLHRSQKECRNQQHPASEPQKQSQNVPQPPQPGKDNLTIKKKQPKPQKEHIAIEESALPKQGYFSSATATEFGSSDSSKENEDGKWDRFKKICHPETEEAKKFKENMMRTIAPPGLLSASKSRRSIHCNDYLNAESLKDSHSKRKEERAAMESLNNRLARYIDRVRTLQNQNHTLYHQVSTFEEYKQKEICKMKEIYEKQIEELKNDLGNGNINYNQLKADTKQLLRENGDLKDTLKKKDVNLLRSIDKEHLCKMQLRNLGNKISRIEDEQQRNENQMRNLLPEVSTLKIRLDDAKRKLDEKKLKSDELETNCQQLEEKVNNEIPSIEKEIVRVKFQEEDEISNIEANVNDEYKDRLSKELQELRDMSDHKMQQDRNVAENLHATRFRELQSQLSKKRGYAAATAQELKDSRSRIAKLNNKVSELEGANLCLNQKISEMSKEMKNQRLNHWAQLPPKEHEIKRILGELSNQRKKYRDLLEIKAKLDMEIAVFRRLVEIEEDCHNTDK